MHQIRQVTSVQPNRVAFDTSYKIGDATLVSKSELAFLPRANIERLLNGSGLEVQSVFGDWDGSAFNELASDEMIFVAGQRDSVTVP